MGVYWLFLWTLFSTLVFFNSTITAAYTHFACRCRWYILLAFLTHLSSHTSSSLYALSAPPFQSLSCIHLSSSYLSPRSSSVISPFLVFVTSPHPIFLSLFNIDYVVLFCFFLLFLVPAPLSPPSLLVDLLVISTANT